MPPIVEVARKLRRQMSLPEVLLWQRLRGAPEGVRFRRGHPIGDYVADFYCASARLVIEVDGQVHERAANVAGDDVRDRFMKARGLDIVRVPARDVLRDVDQAAASILALAAAPLHHRAAPGGPPPRPGEE